MNKCHSPIGWQNDTTPAINETNLNYMDGCIDTIDDRVVAMDSSKLESEDIEDVIVSVTMDDDTGIFTFTKYDGTTFTIDTKLEKIAVNFRYDTATQKLIITLDDGTTQEIDLSSLIQETDFSDSSTIVWTVTNHVASASIKANSIGDAQMQTGYLTDVQAAATTASTAATNANTSKLQSEGFAVGEQNGVPVGSTSPYYHNNAKYYAQQAGGTSLVGLSDVSITSPQDGQALVYNSTTQKWENDDVSAVAELGDLTNVQLSTPTDGQGLVYDADTQKWVNDTIETAKTNNKNLLDNPWFTINQRGATAGTHTAYHVDRWKWLTSTGANTLSISNNTLTVNFTRQTSGSEQSFVAQPVEDALTSYLDGKTVTMSVKVNGVVRSTTFAFDSSADTEAPLGVSGLSAFYNHTSKLIALRITAIGTYNITAIKLELGSTSTLANDEAPDYATELLRCQRYFWNYNATAGFSAVASIEPGAGSTSSCYILVNTPTQMRANPVVTVDTYGNIFPQRSTVTALTFYSRVGNCITLHANTSSSQNMGMGFLNNTKFSLSADL